MLFRAVVVDPVGSYVCPMPIQVNRLILVMVSTQSQQTSPHSVDSPSHRLAALVQSLKISLQAALCVPLGKRIDCELVISYSSPYKELACLA